MSDVLGLLVMAYGTPSGPDDVERYYTDIRRGRPPTPEALAELRGRYEAIGNTFPLAKITQAQAEGLAAELTERGRPARAYVGMKHSPPFVPDAVRSMRADGIERAVGLVLAPHYSRLSVGDYIDRARSADGPEITFVESWYDNHAFLDLLADRVREVLPSPDALVVFTAHSLPTRILEWNDPYPDQLRATAEAVAERAGLGNVTVAWQSAGRTPEPWLTPTLEEVIAETDVKQVVVCACGFTSDHLEVLYDIDIEAHQLASQRGIELARTASPNDDPHFIAALADVVESSTP